jgi:hypothetical protein
MTFDSSFPRIIENYGPIQQILSTLHPASKRCSHPTLTKGLRGQGRGIKRIEEVNKIELRSMELGAKTQTMDAMRRKENSLIRRKPLPSNRVTTSPITKLSYLQPHTQRIKASFCGFTHLISTSHLSRPLHLILWRKTSMRWPTGV